LIEKLRYYASDYDPTVLVIERHGLKLSLNSNEKLVEIAFAPFVFNLVNPENFKRYPINHLVRTLLERVFVPKLMAAYARKELFAERVSLFCPRARQLEQSDPRFHLRAHNILLPFVEPGKAHVIRAMNVLNPAYFSAEEVASVIKNFSDGLFNQGLLITGSNQDPDTPLDGGIYQKSGARFKKVWHSGRGSPVDAAILGA